VSATLEPAVRKSGFVSFVAWFGIASGAAGTLGCLALLPALPSSRMVIGLLSSAALLSTSLGLRARREWARQGFILVLVYTALMGVVGALRARAPRLSDIAAAGVAPPPGVTQEQLDALGPTIRTAALVAAVVGIVVNGLLILSFCSKRVRREFDAESERSR